MRLLCSVMLFFSLRAFAFDYEGHHFINDLAVSALPADFPDFAKTKSARERIAYLGGEPDRWRNGNELALKHINNPDHYFDLEDLRPLDLTIQRLTPFRYEFVAQIARARAAHPERFEPIDLTRDPERIRALPGFLPWTIAEYYAKLESGFSTLKAHREAGRPEEIANTEQSIIYIMGMLGHFVADSSQPLHVTRHFNGWAGANPKGYTTNKNFHAWIDGGFLEKVGFPTLVELQPRLRPAHALWTNSSGPNSPVFPAVAKYVASHFKQVEPLYELEKNGQLDATSPRAGEGRNLICDQMVIAAQMLSDLWQTAWLQAPPDTFLQSALAKRKLKP